MLRLIYFSGAWTHAWDTVVHAMHGLIARKLSHSILKITFWSCFQCDPDMPSLL